MSLTLEQYVQQGLAKEWKFSWSMDSLRAGAVAYRTYGAYFVNHPLTEDYDICSTISCQVFVSNATPKSSVIAASNDTSGVLMAKSGNPILAEYAEETNGLAVTTNPCADGYTGETVTNKIGPNSWPCMPDALSAGATAGIDGKTGLPLHEHGRGMSQNGSQRWATGKNHLGQKVTESTPWQCILDHYYNDSGNETSSSLGARTSFQSGGHGDGLIAYTEQNHGGISNLDGSSFVPLETNGWAAWAPSQKLLLVEADASPNCCTVNWNLVDTNGKISTPLSFGSITPNIPVSWAPIGTTHYQRVVFNGADGLTDGDLYTMNPEGGHITRITNNGANAVDLQPSFSSDGKLIAALEIQFTSPITHQIVVMNQDGSGKIALTPQDGVTECIYPSWSPDGKKILASCRINSSSGAVASNGVYVIDADGSGMIEITRLATTKSAAYPQYTQDGQNIILSVVESVGGRALVETMKTNGAGRHTIVASAPYVLPYGVVQVTRCRRFDQY